MEYRWTSWCELGRLAGSILAVSLHTVTISSKPVLSDQPAKRREAAGHPSTSKLRGIAQSRMWKWLFDAHRLFGVSVDVLDDRLTVLTVPVSRQSVLRRDAEPSTVAAMEDAVTDCIATAIAAVIAVGDRRFACNPIVVGGSAAGAVLVGAEETRLGDQELARAGSLLASAIVDELSRPLPEHGDSLHKISAFYQLLHAAIATGSDREVVRTVAEALSVWDEIEVFAYRADLDGRYTLDTSLPGSDRSARPNEIDATPFQIGGGLLRLPAHHRQDLGFTLPGDTALVHLAADGGPWIISMTAASDPTKAERSELYVAAVGHAMNAALGVETARLTWALMQHFVDSQSPHDAAARALDETAAAVNGEGGFVVFGPDGPVILSVGRAPDVEASSEQITSGKLLRARVDVPAPYAAVLEMRAATAEQAFTRRDARLFEAAVANFGMWLTSAIRRLGPELERRGVARSFDQILDGYVKAAHASNDAASFLLLSARPASLSLQMAHAWIKLLRPQLRPTDLAGRLTSGEVGILLLQTSQPGAQVVARRLARALESGSAGTGAAVRIGIASQDEDPTTVTTLVERARVQGLTTPVVPG